MIDPDDDIIDDIIMEEDDTPDEALKKWRESLMGKKLSESLMVRVQHKPNPTTPYIMIRCSPLLRRRASLAATRFDMSRESWCRAIIAIQVAEVLGDDYDDLLVGGPKIVRIGESAD